MPFGSSRSAGAQELLIRRVPGLNSEQAYVQLKQHNSRFSLRASPLFWLSAQ
jgi:hypothetical protein